MHRNRHTLTVARALTLMLTLEHSLALALALALSLALALQGGQKDGCGHGGSAGRSIRRVESSGGQAVAVHNNAMRSPG